MGMNHTKKPSPLVGEGGNRQVDGRGKLEQKRKNKNMYDQKQKNIEMAHTKKLSPDTGKVSAELTKGARVSKIKKTGFTEQY